jgi:UDP-2,3-diacylglucosamine pyrophosphatase LpxH
VATTASLLVTQELAARLSRLTAPGAGVLNGDCFELLAGPQRSVAASLDAHPAFEAALASARAAGAALVVTVGNHDGRLAWDREASRTVVERIGAQLCFTVDLVFDTARGQRAVRVEHGNRFDAANAFHDARDRHDTPLGHHIVEEILPELEARPFLRDVAWLADPSQFARFLGSRVVYRQLARRWWWLLVPFLAAMAVRTPVVVRALSDERGVRHVERWLAVASVGLGVDLVFLVVVSVLVARRVFSALASSRLGPRGAHQNEPPRAAAEALCSEGFAGLVTGHTHHAELTPVPGGFYANTGCGVEAVESGPARLGLPPVFAGVRRRSWIEIEASHQLRVQLSLEFGVARDLVDDVAIPPAHRWVLGAQ